MGAIRYIVPMEQKLSIFIVEDDNDIAKLLCRLFTAEGYIASSCANGLEACRRIPIDRPDLVILDMMLPGLDGVEVCQRLRPDYGGGILMLTARDDELNEAIALNAGIDDYVCKPIKPHILLARVNALLRRTVKQKNAEEIVIQDLLISRQKRQLSCAGQPVKLSDSEFELLWLLAQSKGEVVSRESLFVSLRGVAYDGLDRSIDMRVSQLRKVLQAASPDREYIRTLRGIGYILIESPA